MRLAHEKKLVNRNDVDYGIDTPPNVAESPANGQLFVAAVFNVDAAIVCERLWARSWHRRCIRAIERRPFGVPWRSTGQVSETVVGLQLAAFSRSERLTLRLDLSANGANRRIRRSHR